MQNINCLIISHLDIPKLSPACQHTLLSSKLPTEKEEVLYKLSYVNEHNSSS